METSEHLCSEAPTEPTGETPLSQSTRLQACGYAHISVGGIVGATIRCSLFLWTSSSQAAYHFLPVCLNVVFLFLPRSLTAASFRSLCSHKRSWQNHIPSSRSFRCNRLSGNKKAGTQMRTDSPQKDRLIPFAVVASHSCNRL